MALETTAAKLPPGRARRLVEANLADEWTRPRSHVELFDDFAAAVGVRIASPSPRIAQLVGTYHDAAHAGLGAALAVIVVYEVQVRRGRRHQGGVAPLVLRRGLGWREFWTVHVQLEDTHASWSAQAVTDLSSPSKHVS